MVLTSEPDDEDAFYGDLMSSSFGVPSPGAPASPTGRTSKRKVEAPNSAREEGFPVRPVRSFLSPSRRDDSHNRRGARSRGRAGGGRGSARSLSYQPPAGGETGALGSVDFERAGATRSAMKAQVSAERRDPKQTDVLGAGGDKHRSEAHVDRELKGHKKKWIWAPNPRNPREVAFQVLLKRETKGSTAFIEALLEESIGKSSLEPADRGLCKEIVLGCVRWRDMLDELVIRRQKGSRKQQPAVRCLLRMGLYQIVLLDKIPSHAAVSETVGLARRCGQGKEAGFVNAVLRAYADDEEATREVIADMQAQDPAVAWSHPKWLVKDWVKRYGGAATQLLMEWNNRAAGSFARVNRLRASPEELLERWGQEGVLADRVPLEWSDDGDVFNVSLPRAVDTLESFEQGLFYMQDPSTLLAVHALQPLPGETVVDLCAAPGGKACMIAQRMGNQGCIVASDIDDERLARVRENSERLGVTCLRTVSAPLLDAALAGMAGAVDSGGDERAGSSGKSSEGRGGAVLGLVDRVLVDAPCSNTGVMRRRVDLRWRLRKEEIAALHEVQFGLLERAAGLVRPGGVVVYSTCSIEPDENEHVVRRFLKARDKCEPGAWELEYSRQASPLTDATDGAFVARLRRLQ